MNKTNELAEQGKKNAHKLMCDMLLLDVDEVNEVIEDENKLYDLAQAPLLAEIERLQKENEELKAIIGMVDEKELYTIKEYLRKSDGKCGSMSPQNEKSNLLQSQRGNEKALRFSAKPSDRKRETKVRK